MAGRTKARTAPCIGATAHGGLASFVTVGGKAVLEDGETGPYRVEILGQAGIVPAEATEVAENTRAVRRGKARPRRLLHLKPQQVNLSEGPATVVLRSKGEPAGAAPGASAAVHDLALRRRGAAPAALGDRLFDDLSDLCEVVYLPRTEGISSTEVRQSVLRRATA
ncbi:MAG: hypothetical protein R3D63_14235 [Paracoccaceae bacterium]